MFQIRLNHFIGHLSRCCAKVAPCPKMTTPKPLAQMWKFFKQSARRSPLDSPHYFTCRHCGWCRNKNMYMVFAHNTLDYSNLKRLTRLSDKLSNSQSNIFRQYLVAILRHPHKMILDIEYRMTPISILHTLPTICGGIIHDQSWLITLPA